MQVIPVLSPHEAIRWDPLPPLALGPDCTVLSHPRQGTLHAGPSQPLSAPGSAGCSWTLAMPLATLTSQQQPQQGPEPGGWSQGLPRWRGLWCPGFSWRRSEVAANAESPCAEQHLSPLQITDRSQSQTSGEAWSTCLCIQCVLHRALATPWHREPGGPTAHQRSGRLQSPSRRAAQGQGKRGAATEQDSLPPRVMGKPMGGHEQVVTAQRCALRHQLVQRQSSYCVTQVW